MLETFKARLKAKSTAAGANLSQKRIDAIADKLNLKFPDLTDEAEHDTKIDDLYDGDTLKDFAAVDDYQRAKEKREADKKKTDASKDKDDKKEDVSDKDDMPAWFKPFADKIVKQEQKEAQQTMQQKLSANEKLKGIDAKLYSKWQLPKSDEEIDAFADEVVETYGHLVKDEGTVHIPGKAGGSTVAKTGKVSPEIKAFVEKNSKTEEK